MSSPFQAMFKKVPFIDNYMTLRQGFVQPLTKMEAVKAAQNHLTHLMKKDLRQLRMGVILDDPEDKLELALRSCVGAMAPCDRAAAQQLLEGLVSAGELTPRPIRARAWSLLAHVHWIGRAKAKGSEEWTTASVQRAAECANEACALGFAPPGLLMIGMQVEGRGYRRHEDRHLPATVTAEFAVLSELWRAVDCHKAKVILDVMHKDTEACKDPEAFICAAEGCELEPTATAPLRKCAGKCDAQGKPAYCSKECQKKDWARHKQFCRTGTPVDEVAAAKRQEKFGDEDLVSPKLRSINLTDPEWAPHFEWFLAGSTEEGKAAFTEQFGSLLGREQSDSSETAVPVVH